MRLFRALASKDSRACPPPPHTEPESLCPSFLYVSVIEYYFQKQSLWRVSFLPVLWESQGKNSKHGQKQGRTSAQIRAWLLTLGQVSLLLTSWGPAYKTVPPTVVWGFLHQVAIKTVVHRHVHKPTWSREVFVKMLGCAKVAGSPSQVTHTKFQSYFLQ